MVTAGTIAPTLSTIFGILLVKLHGGTVSDDLGSALRVVGSGDAFHGFGSDVIGHLFLPPVKDRIR